MVTFLCHECQEILKKPKVDAHCGRCRNCWVLSCVDCGKEFSGDEYRAHVSCISEAEKYQGALYRPKVKGGEPKGVTKQNQWTDLINHAASNAAVSPEVGEVLTALLDYENVPRKHKKFDNFLVNSLGIRAGPATQTLRDAVWKALEGALVAALEKTNAEKKAAAEEKERKSAEAKRKREEEEEEEEEDVGTQTKKAKKFSWKSALGSAVSEDSKASRVRRRVMRAFRESTGDDETQADDVWQKKVEKYCVLTDGRYAMK